MALFGKPQYSTVTVKKKDIPKDLWTKCPKTGEIIYNRVLKENLMVVPSSGYHFPLKARDRIASMLDEGTFEEMDMGVHSLDPLEFNATSSYPEKLKQNQDKTKETDTVISGMGTMGGMPVSIAVMDFRFMAASLGSAAGEKITRAIERGVEKKCPVIIVSASGGARMQEGILSLMQLAKTSAALAKLSEAGLPYFSILTNPTMAGVMASYASLGDVIIAEPEALIGFAGPRVIKETTQQDLPAGFQTSEFLLEHGLVDLIIPRGEMRDRMINLIKALYGSKKSA
ncbi:acetyl-CoA carboxylase, carboxyltransferase subunit beta [Coraliomargarita algicola]|uniref:Acetyl-coenzyme A carboxylase carboxyl transferase subunit beta n=3 Tax=Coraliomargaritaceae TaxID=3056371 RepID=A0ABU1ASU8_9BACT|nr:MULTISPECIES: acetyl-CoA carboxylase, carboxyltransferase subunit beta [unclassified Coraliomargarita]MDQ8194392.1 acetyl-CoA carboxylase, carboxyltransferase subunit beta [Coraliomargarita sp. SDUM461004]MDQ8207237.1 acetyl-CoA carboxylase, carboxyltransferase subunit beta [Coraliomargarita sp. SDUM461003]WPJ94119.1 acetyl-CoA carboxylase, carboxyltransferase subunit beta [Coraliomargarita sp. J2-16]